MVVLLFRLTEESLEEDEEETGGEEGGAAEESEGQQGRHPLSPGLTTTLNSSLQSWLAGGRVFLFLSGNCFQPSVRVLTHFAWLISR